MNRKYAALVGAAFGVIGFFCGGGSRAQPINVTVQVFSGAGYGNVPPQDYYFFSVTNNLSGGDRIYQFIAAFGPFGPAIVIGGPTGFDVPDAFTPSWTDDDYNSAIAPGETGYFEAFTYADYIPPSIPWGVSVESGPNGEGTVLFEGAAETIPEPSTWAMMLLGFTGLGLAGYRTPRARVDASAA
jgi:PEP-CTERM motif